MSDAVPASLRHVPRPVVFAAALVGVLVAAAIALWARFGNAVFYEMIVAGLSLCF
jgi:hypothetical protein